MALDSAGFVAMVRYGDYPWSVKDYMDLVAAGTWAWYSAPDFCCEPEVAGSHNEVSMRVARTACMLGVVNREADERGLTRPMPILQGWEKDDYLRCADLLPIWEWPSLVGVGSMCRRDVGGPNGIVAIVEALDQRLPSHVKFHLFGVKSFALDVIGNHPRIASVDSMAWDFALRKKIPVGRTQEIRANEMTSWQRAQAERAGGGRYSFQPDFGLEVAPTFKELATQIVREYFASLASQGEIEHQRASSSMNVDQYVAEAVIHNHGSSAFLEEDPPDDFDLGDLWAPLHRMAISVSGDAPQDALLHAGAPTVTHREPTRPRLR